MKLRGSRLAVHAVALVGVLASPACKDDAKTDDSGAAQPDAPAPAPSSEDAFLAELAPLPDNAEAIELHYEIRGPALRGEMVVTVAAGGKRREQWELRAETGETELRTAGLTVINPEHRWVGTDGAGGELHQNHLAGLARAYLALEPDARAKVAESIRAWHRMLAEQRERDGGERDELLGVSCLRTRIAGQNVCMWEETGLLLRYEGSAFTIEATEIDRSPTLEPGAFVLPPEARTLEPKPGETPNYAGILDEIAEGSYGSVSLLVLGGDAVPALRVPQ